VTISDLTPLLRMYEILVLENYALRQTLADLPKWDDETVNAHKEKWRPFVAQQFAEIYKHADNPTLLHRILSEMLRSKKPN
jgi:hypothetical protein